MRKLALPAVLLLLSAAPALAHVGVGSTSSFNAGFLHPLGGLDHIAVMVAVGLWAVLKGGRAIWIWPAAFVAVMIVGGVLGMADVTVRFVEPVILASVVALGFLVLLAVDLPVGLGAAVIGGFALFHGHAHGVELPETGAGMDYLGGFSLATALLHLAGIAFAIVMSRLDWRVAARFAGAACIVAGVAMVADILWGGPA
jgi:urease accessory protein